MRPLGELSEYLSLAEIFGPFFVVSLAIFVTILLYDAFERVILWQLASDFGSGKWGK